MSKQRKILAVCIAVSLSLHMGFFLFLQTHSFGFLSYQNVAFKPFSFSLEKAKRDQILKKSFAPAFMPHVSQKYSPASETLIPRFCHMKIQHELPALSLTSSFSFEDLLSSNAFPVPVFPLPQLQTLDLFAALPKDLIIPSEQPIHSKTFLPNEEHVPIVSQEKTIDPIQPKEMPIAFSSVASFSLVQDSSKIVPTIPIPALPRVPTLADLDTVNLSSSFDAELTFSPRKDGPGYLFALTLIPRSDLQIQGLQQHLIFLIDRSNSVQYDRLLAIKAAVSQSVEELEEGDMFNIIAFDNKTEKLSPSLIRMSPGALTKTNEFLNKIQLGSFFSASDLYKPLFTTIPARAQEDEIYTAILLTDGESLAKKTMQEALMRDWTLQNCGRVVLYAVSMENDAHLGTLDAACHFNQGRLIYTNSHRGLKRKLLQLTKNIKNPIAKNITFKAISKSPHTKVELHPTPSPAIYLDQPYVLLGSTETAEDFVLFIQGRLKNKWFNIKKTISFVDAKKGGTSLQSVWALQKAYQYYEKYVFGGDQKYLTEAKHLLEPFNLQIAFQ